MEGPGWSVLELPAARFQPVTLPRVLVVHHARDGAEVAAAVAPWRAELGTVGTTDEAAAGRVLGTAHGLRRCGIGEMQRPPGDRPEHDGIDVMEWLWQPSR